MANMEWFSQNEDAILEQQAIIAVLENNGYTSESLSTINTVEILWSVIYKSSMIAYDNNLPISRHASFDAKSATEFAKKMVGNIGEYLVDAVINSKQHGKLVPSHWSKSIHRADYGIEDKELGSPDRIILDENGEPYAALQAKFYNIHVHKQLTNNEGNLSNSYTWVNDELCEYPMLSSMKEVALFTNLLGPDKPRFSGGRLESPKLQKHLDVTSKEQTARQQFWDDFWHQLFFNVEDYLFNQTKPIALTPDAFQYNRMIKPLEQLVGPGIVSGPCGIGKMICQGSILSKNRGINLVFSGNRLALASQTYKSYNRDIDTGFNSIFVMSKNDFQQKNHGIDTKAKHCATIQSIANSIYEYTRDGGQRPLNIFVIEQSYYKVVDALHLLQDGGLISPRTNELYSWCENTATIDFWWNKITNLLFDAIYDEAHNLVTGESKNSGDDEDRRKSRYLYDLPWMNEIFNRSTYWTATIRKNGTIRGMENTSMFGHVVASILPSEAINRGYTVAPYLIPITLDNNDVIEFEGIEDGIDLAYYIKSIKHAKIINDSIKQPTRIILFVNKARNQEEYKRIIDETFKSEDIYSAVVRAETPHKRREEVFSNFASSDFSVLINYAIVNEGIDIPGCNGVILGRDMNDVMLIQSMGRPIRLDTIDRELHGPNSKDPDISKYKKTKGLIYYFVDHTKSSSEGSYDELKALLWKIRKLTDDTDWFVTTRGTLGRTNGHDSGEIDDSQFDGDINSLILDDKIVEKMYVEQDNSLKKIQELMEINDTIQKALHANPDDFWQTLTEEDNV